MDRQKQKEVNDLYHRAQKDSFFNEKQRERHDKQRAEMVMAYLYRPPVNLTDAQKVQLELVLDQIVQEDTQITYRDTAFGEGYGYVLEINSNNQHLFILTLVQFYDTGIPDGMLNIGIKLWKQDEGTPYYGSITEEQLFNGQGKTRIQNAI